MDGIIISMFLIAIAALFIFVFISLRSETRQPDWNLIKRLISIVKPGCVELIETAEKKEEERFNAVRLLCEALIEGGYISSHMRPQLFEQAERLIELLSTAQKERHDCLGQCVGYYEMIGKQTQAQVLMNELFKMPPPEVYVDAPPEVSQQMIDFWCRMIDGQRQRLREDYSELNRPIPRVNYRSAHVMESP